MIDQARAARADAERLRAYTLGLRLSVRHQLRLGARGVEDGCWAYMRSQRLQAEARLGGWSSLPWQAPRDELDDVLVPVPSRDAGSP